MGQLPPSTMIPPDSNTRFQACMPWVLKQECPFPEDWTSPHNFDDDAHDPGGKTFCGITQKEYDVYRKHNDEPVRDVRKLTQEEGTEIYYGNYWEPHCDDLPTGLDLVFFDESVNTGTVEAIRVLQASLGIANDGEWGPETDSAVKAITDVTVAVNKYTTRRETVYKEMSGFPYFGKGWLNRCADILSDAEEMCS